MPPFSGWSLKMSKFYEMSAWKILFFIIGSCTITYGEDRQEQVYVGSGVTITRVLDGLKIRQLLEHSEVVSEDPEFPHYNVPNEEPETINSTLNETNANVTQKVISCKPGVGGEPVRIVNGSELIKILMPDGNITSKDAPAECVLILFYAKYCTFSSMAAPHFNALSRAFPYIKLAAIDAMKHHIFNTQNGIVGVPTLILFHNGRPISKFNDTEYTLELYSRFLTKYTGLKPEEKSYVTSADFAGPVSSTPEKDTDYFLGLSWMFIIICVIYYFTKSKWWKWIVETVQITWRESEAQHEHND